MAKLDYINEDLPLSKQIKKPEGYEDRKPAREEVKKVVSDSGIFKELKKKVK
jgi:hypothetical protein